MVPTIEFEIKHQRRHGQELFPIIAGIIPARSVCCLLHSTLLTGKDTDAKTAPPPQPVVQLIHCAPKHG